MITRLVDSKPVLIDEQDAHLLDEYNWHIEPTLGYVRAYNPVSKRSNIKSQYVFLHNLILPPPPGLEVDHQDVNPRNNTRANLRLATRSQNHANRRKFRNASSQYKGVSLVKASGRWACVMKIGRKAVHLGTFDHEADAARVYDAKARELYGEFARVNFP